MVSRNKKLKHGMLIIFNFCLLLKIIGSIELLVLELTQDLTIDIFGSI